MFYIYIIQNKLDLKIYVGQTIDPKERWRRHKSQARMPAPKQFIHRAIKKYGIDNFNFQIIEEWELEKDAFEAEKFYIQYFQTQNSEIGYNLTAGGDGSRGFKHSEESKIKISELAHKRYENLSARQKQSEATTKHYMENPDAKNKISSGLKRYFTESKNREKHSLAQKKRFENPEAVKKNSEALKKYYANPDAVKKNKETQIKYFSEHPEVKLKMSLLKKKKYSTEIVAEVKILHASGWKNVDIAKKFNMPVNTVSGIITGRKRKYG